MKKKQNRKKRVKNGERTSKMCSFRADAVTMNILTYVSNKGRLINRLIQRWGRDKGIWMDDPHADPDENDLDYWMP